MGGESWWLLPFFLLILLLTALVSFFSYTPSSPTPAPTPRAPVSSVQAWDGIHPWPAPGLQCRWIKGLCIRRESDMISNEIARTGRWSDCDGAVEAWRRTMHPGLIVDIGANIGACALALLHASGGPVAAFEPLPANLFYLTHSIMASSLWRNITVYPVACGATPGLHALYTEPGNAGNSVIDATTGIGNPSAAGTTIRVVACDDVLWPDRSVAAPRIAFLKLDAQGYEMEVLRGMRHLFEARAIRSLKAEFARDWLLDHGTTPAQYCGALRNYSFRLFYDVGRREVGDCMTLDSGPAIVEVYGFLG